MNTTRVGKLRPLMRGESGVTHPVVQQGVVVRTDKIDKNLKQKRLSTGENAVYKAEAADEVYHTKRHDVVLQLRLSNYVSNPTAHARTFACLNGLTKEQLHSIQVAGVAEAGADGRKVISHATAVSGSTTVAHTGPKPIRAGDRVYIRFPNPNNKASLKSRTNRDYAAQRKIVPETHAIRPTDLFATIIDMVKAARDNPRKTSDIAETFRLMHGARDPMQRLAALFVDIRHGRRAAELLPATDPMETDINADRARGNPRDPLERNDDGSFPNDDVLRIVVEVIRAMSDLQALLQDRYVGDALSAAFVNGQIQIDRRRA
eukprot:TRINITY_DN68349_c0_g1_i1.p1 TRINITY_DN68349_c0_g1~~TRINITY_DN68349_c0_g1_i1.p1  ORF type:complete len:318 (-),score=108.59 TRINITY_DN68349_c0_g1_i1:52-1005(-)